MRAVAADLPLRDLIDGIDVVDAFSHRLIALMPAPTDVLSRTPSPLRQDPLVEGIGFLTIF